MSIDFRPLKWALVIGLCAVIIAGELKGQSSKGPFEGLTALLTAGVLVCIVVLAFIADRRDARLFPARWAYASSLFAAASLLLFAGIRAWAAHRDGLPRFIRAGQFQDFSGTSLDLLANGDYEYCDVGLGETCCSGTWRMTGDTIQLTGEGACTQGTMVIRTCRADTTRKCLCWIDGHRTDPEMWLLEDNRPQ